MAFSLLLLSAEAYQTFLSLLIYLFIFTDFLLSH
jgi:hypothetical protein